jgi:23S rRNA (uridine2552-2'-O)-methyltransferase
LGAAPGGWSQVAARKMNYTGRLISLDLLPMEPLHFVHTFQANIFEEKTFDLIRQFIPNSSLDLVMR